MESKENQMTTLSALVAVKVAGFKWYRSPHSPYCRYLKPDDMRFMNPGYASGDEPIARDAYRFVPDYAGFADAVLLLLDNEYAWSCMKNTVHCETTCTHSVYITVRTPEAPDPVQVFHGEARTFEEAACRALCLAHGCSQTEIDQASTQ